MRNIFDDGGGQIESSAKLLGVCRRNYEEEIDRIRKDLIVTEQLSDAIEDYTAIHGIGYHGKAFTLTELYGASKLIEKSLKVTIDNLTAEWQAEIDKANK